MKTDLNKFDYEALYKMIESRTNVKCKSMDDIIAVMADELFEQISDDYTLFDYMVIARANYMYENETVGRFYLVSENPMEFLKNKVKFYKKYLEGAIREHIYPYMWLDNDDDVILSIIDNGLYKGASK